MTEEILIFDKFHSRTCSDCKEGMDSGYCIGDGEEYYCSDECLYNNYSKRQYNIMYNKNEAYWTEWDKEYEYEEYLNELDLSKEEKAKYMATIN